MLEIEISKRNISEIENVTIPNSIERIDDIDYDTFFSQFLMQNRPCIISSRCTDGWPCRQEWITNENGCPNFDKLNTLFGEDVVPVADCNKKYYNAQLKDEMTVKNYLDYWINYRKTNDSNLPLLYLKDWHCVRKFSNILIYKVPQYFASDWLNEYYIAHPELNDDYMFIYMGPKGTWTPLHADVFTSYSWSANIVGKKRWSLFPPNEEYQLRDSHGKLIFDVTSTELNDRTKYKMYNPKTINYFDIVQNEGEILFVPSGWHHQVWNMEDTISINHNWINACNIHNMWTGIKKELSNVMKEVEDCKDMNNWPEHCQLILKTLYGMDFRQFFDFLSFIGEKRLNFLTQGIEFLTFNEYRFGINHCLFDLEALRIVLADFISHTKSNHIYDIVCENNNACQLLMKISSVLH